MYAMIHTLQLMRWKKCAEAGVRIVPRSQSCSEVYPDKVKVEELERSIANVPSEVQLLCYC